MRNFLEWLRSTGDWGGRLATLLGFLLMNWPVTIAGLAGVWVGLNEGARQFAQTPAVYVGAATFLFLLWLLIGLTYLVDRRKPRLTQTHLDYRYGLTFGGVAPNYHSADAGHPDAGTLNFELSTLNYGPGPIKYVLEDIDIRIGTRASPKYIANSISGYMARGASRVSRGQGFKKDELAEFYGKGEVVGSIEFSFLYGPVDGPPLRRLKMITEMKLLFPKDGNLSKLPGQQFGFGDSIKFEEDAPI